MQCVHVCSAVCVCTCACAMFPLQFQHLQRKVGGLEETILEKNKVHSKPHIYSNYCTLPQALRVHQQTITDLRKQLQKEMVCMSVVYNYFAVTEGRFSQFLKLLILCTKSLDLPVMLFQNHKTIKFK